MKISTRFYRLPLPIDILELDYVIMCVFRNVKGDGCKNCTFQMKILKKRSNISITFFTFNVSVFFRCQKGQV